MIIICFVQRFVINIAWFQYSSKENEVQNEINIVYEGTNSFKICTLRHITLFSPYLLNNKIKF